MFQRFCTKNAFLGRVKNSSKKLPQSVIAMIAFKGKTDDIGINQSKKAF